MYECLVEGIVVAEFKTYAEAEDYMVQTYGIHWRNYDMGII